MNAVRVLADGPRIVPARVFHVEQFAPWIRAADRAEIWASHRMSPEAALDYGIRSSSHAWAGFVDDTPVCVFGVTPRAMLGRVGTPWMLGTDAVERHAVTFLRRSRPCVSAMRAEYDALVNYVDARNLTAARWLRWLGFTLAAPEPYGPDRLPFHPFEWRRAPPEG